MIGRFFFLMKCLILSNQYCRGDTAFCSEECRAQQMKEDERKEKRSVMIASKNGERHASSSTTSSKSSRKSETVAAAWLEGRLLLLFKRQIKDHLSEMITHNVVEFPGRDYYYCISQSPLLLMIGPNVFYMMACATVRGKQYCN